MNEVSITINRVKYDVVEMTREENDMAVSCTFATYNTSVKTRP